MINKLSIETINSKSPYLVDMVSDFGPFVFTSDSGVELAVDFVDDDLITSTESYQLVVSNVNNRQSPRDKKIQDTVFAIVEEFFEKNQAALLYVCETGDGKQMARYRLFRYWFDMFEYSKRYTSLSTSLTDEEGIMNAATVFIRNDNPHLPEIVSEFNETAMLLRQKPN